MLRRLASQEIANSSLEESSILSRCTHIFRNQQLAGDKTYTRLHKLKSQLPSTFNQRHFIRRRPLHKNTVLLVHDCGAPHQHRSDASLCHTSIQLLPSLRPGVLCKMARLLLCSSPGRWGAHCPLLPPL